MLFMALCTHIVHVKHLPLCAGITGLLSSTLLSVFVGFSDDSTSLDTLLFISAPPSSTPALCSLCACALASLGRQCFKIPFRGLPLGNKTGSPSALAPDVSILSSHACNSYFIKSTNANHLSLVFV